MSEKRKYVDENQKWFIDFLPSEVFYSLTSEDQVRYDKSKDIKKLLDRDENLIKDNEKQIKFLQGKNKELRYNIDGDSENDGYKSKLKFLYDSITSVDKGFSFNCTIEKRDRSSKSHKKREGKIRKNVKDTEFGIEKYYYKGERITAVYIWYSKVYNSVHSGGFYLGKEEEIKQFLSDLYNEDWSIEDEDTMRSEIRGIISQYSRYKIYHTNWIEFKSDTHNLKSLREWCDKMGEKRYEWGGVK